MDKKQVFTSTGLKLLSQTNFLDNVFSCQYVSPLSLQVAPSSNCNLGCSFCSNRNRSNGEELDKKVLKVFLKRMWVKGAKTVEWTGGGEPTLFSHLNEIMEDCFNIGYQQGLITNGTRLKHIKTENLDRLTWIRISMNVLDERDEIEIPKFPKSLTLGFSYVINNRTTEEILNRLKQYVKKYNPAYVRIVPNCQATPEEQEENNKQLAEIVETWGEPFFYQDKHFNTAADHCWWCYVKPFILHDGYVYPCSSVVLNSDSDERFNEKFRWCHITELPDKYLGHKTDSLKVKCDRCVFGEQNKLLDSLLNPTGMEDFV